jgi:transposase-like protein
LPVEPTIPRAAPAGNPLEWVTREWIETNRQSWVRTLVDKALERRLLPWLGAMRAVAGRRRSAQKQVTRTADLMAAAEAQVVAYLRFAQIHRTQIHCTNPLAWINAEIERTTAAPRHSA